MKKNFLLSVVLAMVVISLLACGSGPSRRLVWVNHNERPEMLQHRFTIDSTECAALANQYFGESPSPPRAKSGNMTLYTPGGTVFGTYEENQPLPSQGYRPDGFLEGMQRPDRERAQRNYALACMADRGWERREQIEGN